MRLHAVIFIVNVMECVIRSFTQHADQIRSTPFSGDSSDSSDEEHTGSKLAQSIQSSGSVGRRPSASGSPAKGKMSSVTSGLLSSPSRKLITTAGMPSTPTLGQKRGNPDVIDLALAVQYSLEIM